MPQALQASHARATLLLFALALSGCADAPAPTEGSLPTGATAPVVEIIEDEGDGTDADQQADEGPEQGSADPAVLTHQAELDAAIAELEARGASMSYYIVDLATGESLEHNADATYYSASTIKAPYCISLLRDQGDSARSSHGGAIEATIVNSDNEAYETLREAYANRGFFQSLVSEAGATFKAARWYNYYSVRDLANLWRVSYPWLVSGDENAMWIAGLLTNTLNSRVDDIAGLAGATTWSKAGWYPNGGPEYNVTFDGGIVNAPYGPYALAVATNRGSDFKAIESVMTPLVGLWDARHAS